MRCGMILGICVLILCVTSRVPAQTDAGNAVYVPVTMFDSSRDAATDIRSAVVEAERTGRRVLLDVGGNWCVWCRRLDAMFISNTELASTRDKYFVTVKVNYSPANKNEALLSRYPKIPGYPHLFVLEKDGKLLQSQSTGDFESGKGYDPSRIMAFLKKWAPKK